MKDELGDKVKAWEAASYQDRLDSKLPVIVRLDGRAFHSYTMNLQKPFDATLTAIMRVLTKHLVEETAAKFGYTQSDEITLLLYNPNGQIYFDGRVQKLTSVLAAECSVYFNHLVRHSTLPYNKLATFDCRVFNTPTKEDAVDVFKWRYYDAKRNSVQMLARSLYSHNQLIGKPIPHLYEMCKKAGHDWKLLEPRYKYGSAFYTGYINRPFTITELNLLPEKHEARKNPELTFRRRFCKIWEGSWRAKNDELVSIIFGETESNV